jgi:hypothetical protein
MKHNFSLGLALTALILAGGCKKSISPSSVNLSKPAKAGFAVDPLWQTPSIWGRIARFDVNSGHGSDCILAYDCLSNHVSLTQVSGSSSTTLFSSSTGFNLVGGGNVPTNDWWSDITDQYAEFGGCHVTTVDINKTGREEHILVYFPLRGWWWLLSYAGNGLWNNEGSGTTGIGGYDLHGITDKIVSYNMGDGYRDALICYRPGNHFFWVLENTNVGNTSSGNHANWVAVVKSSGGVGGYDLAGTYDQILPIVDGSGTMSLICYRPGFRYVFSMNHAANSTSWQTVFISRTGWQNFPLNAQQDRAINFSRNAFANGEGGEALWYSPGSGNSIGEWVYFWEVQFAGGNQEIPTGYQFPYNPYGSTPGVGDHILNFSAATNPGFEPNGLLYYTNGGAQSQIYEGQATFYNQVY